MMLKRYLFGFFTSRLYIIEWNYAYRLLIEKDGRAF